MKLTNRQMDKAIIFSFSCTVKLFKFNSKKDSCLHPLLQIVLNVPLFATEVRTNQGYLFAAYEERLGVVLLFDLGHRLFGCAVVFELEDIDVIGCLDGHIYTSVGGVKLSFRVESAEVAKDEKHVLVVIFSVLDEVVWCVCEE